MTRGRKAGLIIVLVLACLIIGGAAMALFGCKLKGIQFSETGRYTEEELALRLIDGEYMDNTLYFWYYYNHNYKKDIPFVKSVNVKLKGPHTVSVSIEENQPIGYVEYADSYLYVDRSGVIVDNSTELLEGVPKVEGFNIDVAEKGELLPVENKSHFNDMIEVLTSAQRLDIELSRIVFSENGTITAYSGNIEVRLGLGEHLEDKMRLTSVLLPEVAGKSGILHMEDYDGTNGTRSFEENAE